MDACLNATTQDLLPETNVAALGRSEVPLVTRKQSQLCLLPHQPFFVLIGEIGSVALGFGVQLTSSKRPLCFDQGLPFLGVLKLHFILPSLWVGKLDPLVRLAEVVILDAQQLRQEMTSRASFMVNDPDARTVRRCARSSFRVRIPVVTFLRAANVDNKVRWLMHRCAGFVAQSCKFSYFLKTNLFSIR